VYLFLVGGLRAPARELAEDDMDFNDLYKQGYAAGVDAAEELEKTAAGWAWETPVSKLHKLLTGEGRAEVKALVAGKHAESAKRFGWAAPKAPISKKKLALGIGALLAAAVGGHALGKSSRGGE